MCVESFHSKVGENTEESVFQPDMYTVSNVLHQRQKTRLISQAILLCLSVLHQFVLSFQVMDSKSNIAFFPCFFQVMLLVT